MKQATDPPLRFFADCRTAAKAASRARSRTVAPASVHTASQAVQGEPGGVSPEVYAREEHREWENSDRALRFPQTVAVPEGAQAVIGRCHRQLLGVSVRLVLPHSLPLHADACSCCMSHQLEYLRSVVGCDQLDDGSMLTQRTLTWTLQVAPACPSQTTRPSCATP